MTQDIRWKQRYANFEKALHQLNYDLFDIISRLHAFLEEQSPMPYFFDIIDYTHLEHRELKEHIGRVGPPRSQACERP